MLSRMPLELVVNSEHQEVRVEEGRGWGGVRVGKGEGVKG